MYLPTVVLLGTYGSSVRYHSEHGKYAAKHHVDTGPLRATCTLDFSDTVEKRPNARANRWLPIQQATYTI